MRHIVFLVGSSYPDFSAVGYCAYKVQQCLKTDSSVSVIAYKTNARLSEQCQIDGIAIERIETKTMARRNSLSEKPGSISKWLLYAHRALGAMQRLLAPETVDKDLISAYLKKLESLGRAPDVIVPVAFPIEAVLAALLYKKSNPQVTIIPYLFDDFVDSGSLHVSKIARWLKRNRHLTLERGILEQADAIMAMHPLRKHFERNFPAPLCDKISFLEHPLLTAPSQQQSKAAGRQVRFCFTGSLIRKVREPDYLLQLFRNMRTTTEMQLDFFVMGTAADKVPTGELGAKVWVVNHGRVTKNAADRAILDADILLNIGEKQGVQISSKIFEYMSTGKPIIHIAYVENDAVTKILSHYPLALCIVQGRYEISTAAAMLCKFIEGKRFERLSFAEVSTCFPDALPETTSSTLLKLIKALEKPFDAARGPAQKDE